MLKKYLSRECFDRLMFKLDRAGAGIRISYAEPPGPRISLRSAPCKERLAASKEFEAQ